MEFERGAGQFNRLRQTLSVAILLGLLLVPATCAHASGPHSLFIDPRDEPEPTSNHAHHAPAAQPDAGTAAASGASYVPTGRSTAHDLPGAMLVTIASSAIHLDIPYLIAIPAPQGLESLRATPALTGIAPPVDVPPPRTAQRRELRTE